MPRQLTSREEILDSSAAVAKGHGLDAISIRGVATARGVSTGTIYNYFPSRDELVAATAERLFGEAFYEGFCHPEPDESYLAYCERLYSSLHERLSSSGSGWLRMVCRIEATQAARLGVIQSSCVTRTAPARRSAHRLCQWPGPESRQPGTMTMEGLMDKAFGLIR